MIYDSLMKIQGYVKNILEAKKIDVHALEIRYAPSDGKNITGTYYVDLYEDEAEVLNDRLQGYIDHIKYQDNIEGGVTIRIVGLKTGYDVPLTKIVTSKHDTAGDRKIKSGEELFGKGYNKFGSFILNEEWRNR